MDVILFMKKKYKMGIETIFKKYLGNDSPCYIPSSNQELKKVIDFLHDNEAIAILAHPIYYKKTSIEEFIDLGIDGIECFYPEQEYRIADIQSYCQFYNFLYFPDNPGSQTIPDTPSDSRYRQK